VLSCFTPAAVSRLPGREELTELAALIGRLVSPYLPLRAEVAIAHLRQARATHRAADVRFEEVLKHLITVFDLDAATIWGREPGGRTVRALASTGLVDTRQGDETREVDIANLRLRHRPRTGVHLLVGQTPG